MDQGLFQRPGSSHRGVFAAFVEMGAVPSCPWHLQWTIGGLGRGQLAPPAHDGQTTVEPSAHPGTGACLAVDLALPVLRAALAH